MYKESVAAPVPYDSSIAGFTFDFMKKLWKNCKKRLAHYFSHFYRILAQKYAPFTVASGWGAKNAIVFTAARCLFSQVLCSRRNKVSASRPYAPDTRGVCFQGPSRALWYFRHPALHPVRVQRAGGWFEIRCFATNKACSSLYSKSKAVCAQRFTVSHCCVAQ